MANILSPVGSLRRDSLNTRLAREGAAHMRGDQGATFFDLTDVPFCNEDLRGEPLLEPVVQIRSAFPSADSEVMRRNWDVFADSRK